MIFAFDHEHKLGDVCHAGCPTGDPDASTLTDSNGEYLEVVPLYILRVADRGDYEADCYADGGSPTPHIAGNHYYEVSTD